MRLSARLGPIDLAHILGQSKKERTPCPRAPTGTE